MTSRILWLVMIVQLTACATNEPAAPQTQQPTVHEISTSTPSSPPPIAEPARRASKAAMRLTVAAVGDMMLGTDYPDNRLPDDDGVGFLGNVAPFLLAADFAVGNLEGVLSDGGTAKKVCDNPNACYLFRSPTHYAKHYRDAGFDALSLANNHARDFGEEGRTSSMNALSRENILHSGREGLFAETIVNDLSVAFIAFSVTQKSNLMHDYEVAFATIRTHADNHDIVIVSFHGGAEGANVMRIPFAEEEYYGEPRGDVVWFARGAVDAGADLVLGHGPHVVRGMENYKNRLIAYSLGNFATYYGISVAGNKGVAPILTTTLNGDGGFVGAEIISTVQIRPNGPSVDKTSAALKLIRDLSIQDFRDPGLQFQSNGAVLPTKREPFKSHQLVVSPD